MITYEKPVLNAQRFICFKSDDKQKQYIWMFGNNGESHSEMKEFAKKTHPLATHFIGAFYVFADANATDSIIKERLKFKYDMRTLTEEEEDLYANMHKTIWRSMTIFGVSDSLGISIESFDIAVAQWREDAAKKANVKTPILLKVIEDFEDYHFAEYGVVINKE